MKKIVITYGLISGAIAGGMLLITMSLYEHGVDFKNGQLLGYTTMVVAFSLIFFAVKSCRDNYQQGKITFGTGAKIGLLITLIASLMYAISWEINLSIMKVDFTTQMIEKYIKDKKESGANETEMAEVKKKMEDYAVMYKNPFLRFGITIMEIAPVGILISLLCAALLRKKEFLPSERV